MKKYFALVFFISMNCQAQTTLDSLNFLDRIFYLPTWDTLEIDKPDTIPVIMMVIDTTPNLQVHSDTFLKEMGSDLYDHDIKWMFGYIVRIIFEQNYYLDRWKRPLPKNIFVWDIQPR